MFCVSFIRLLLPPESRARVPHPRVLPGAISGERGGPAGQSRQAPRHQGELCKRSV